MPPAPRPITRSTSLRCSRGSWSRSHVFEPGDQAVFILRFLWVPKPYADNAGWDRPTAHLVIRREIYPYLESCLPSPDEEGVTLVTDRLERKISLNGVVRFSTRVIVEDEPRWVGNHLAMFYVTNGRGAYGVYLPKGLEVIAVS